MHFTHYFHQPAHTCSSPDFISFSHSMRGLTGLPAVPQAPTAGPLHPSPDTHCSPPGLSYSFIQRLLTPLCLMAPTAPGTLDCPPVHSAFCQFSSSWNRSHVISYNFLALLERQLHESDYFVLSTVLFSSTENSTQHIVGMLSCSVMSGSWRPHGL